MKWIASCTEAPGSLRTGERSTPRISSCEPPTPASDARVGTISINPANAAVDAGPLNHRGFEKVRPTSIDSSYAL